MKAKIFLYLFIFAFMYSIFQFINSKRYSEAKEKEVAELHHHIEELKDEVAEYKEAASSYEATDAMDSADSDGFSLKDNPKAREYFAAQQIDPDSVASAIESELISKNQGYKDNPLVPYPGISGNIMRINRVKVLNNKWVLAEFTDGSYWGEAFISYFLDEDNKLQFETQDGVLYER